MKPESYKIYKDSESELVQLIEAAYELGLTPVAEALETSLDNLYYAKDNNLI